MNNIVKLSRVTGYCRHFFNPRILLGRQKHSSATDDPDEPVKFSTSKAATWKAAFSREGVEEEDLSAWFQPYVISLSLSVFLIYFCILREESDIDEKLSTSLYDRIDGLERMNLEISLKHALDYGLDTSEIKKRLKELDLEDEAKRELSS